MPSTSTTAPPFFASLPFIRSGDQIQLLLPDATLATYVVSSAETYDAATAPVAAITGPTDAEVVTLITTGVPGDATKRLVVRATASSRAREPDSPLRLQLAARFKAIGR